MKDLLTISHKQQAQEKKKEKAIMVAETESTTDDNLDKEQPVEEEKVVEEVDGKEEVTVEKLAEYTQTMVGEIKRDASGNQFWNLVKISCYGCDGRTDIN